MILTCLFAQRRESYPGQYLPELFDAVDDLTMSENAEYLEGKINEVRLNVDEFSQHWIVQIDVDLPDRLEGLPVTGTFLVAKLKEKEAPRLIEAPLEEILPIEGLKENDRTYRLPLVCGNCRKRVIGVMPFSVPFASKFFDACSRCGVASWRKVITTEEN